jgi:tetratricopeptide (TPR) repeat protein
VTEQHNQLGGTVLGPEDAPDTDVVSSDPPTPAVEALSGLSADEGLDGRVAESSALAALLSPDRARADAPAVCTIAGPAGTGTTALAVAAARRAEAEGWFPGGVLFVDLHGYDAARRIDASAALAVLLRDLDVPGEQIPQGQTEREAAYRSVLAGLARTDRAVLVVVDNAATLQQALPLWPGAARHRMLVTSRHPLPIPGARRLELGPLSTEDAVAVLARVTRAADEDDTRIADDSAAAAELAQLCEGLPLALRITAGLAADRRDESVTALVARMTAEREKVGEGADVDASPTRVAFEAAHRNLPDEQARLLRLLTLDPGSHVDVDAAAALADTATGDTGALMDGLSRAQLVDTAPGGVGYGMHDLVRRFAVQRCRQDESAQARSEAVHRLLLHYRTGVQEAAGHLDPQVPAESRGSRFVDREAALLWLDGRRHNLVASVALAAGEGLDRLVVDIPLGLLSYFDLRGHVTEWATTTQFAVAAALRLQDRAGEAACRNSLGLAYLASARFEEAGECFDGARGLYEQTEDRRGLAAAVTNVGTAAHHLGRLTDAIGHFERALALYRELDDLHGEASALANLAGSYTDLGRLPTALDHYQRSVALFAAVDDRPSEGRILADVGNVQLRLGRPEKALSTHLRTLALQRGIGNRHEEALTLLGLGNDHDALGHVAEALDCLRQATVLSHELGDRRIEWRALVYLGNVECRRRRYVDAVRAYRRAVVICRDLGEEAEEARALGNLGTAYAQWGKPAEALAVHREALAIHRRTGDRYGEGLALADLGAVHRDLGHRDRASDCYLRSVAAFHETHAADDVSRVERLLADLMRLPS